jgi:hypothetical protein
LYNPVGWRLVDSCMPFDLSGDFLTALRMQVSTLDSMYFFLVWKVTAQ